MSRKRPRNESRQETTSPPSCRAASPSSTASQRRSPSPTTRTGPTDPADPAGPAGPAGPTGSTGPTVDPGLEDNGSMSFLVCSDWSFISHEYRCDETFVFDLTETFLLICSSCFSIFDIFDIYVNLSLFLYCCDSVSAAFAAP